MASVRLTERHTAPSRSFSSIEYSITEVSFVLRDLSWTADEFREKLENEVMVDPWSSMDSSNSPLTDSGPSASEDCTPSTSSEPPRGPLNISSPVSPGACRLQDPQDAKPTPTKPAPYKTTDKARSRDLTLQLDTLEPDPLPRLPHFLDEDYQPPSKTNIECRIPKPHFLDHSPSPDELDERNDITNPNFLDEDGDTDDLQAQRKAGALPKKSLRTHPPTYPLTDERSHRTTYRSTLHYGLESAARSSERDKRASQLYRGTWPGERDVWTGHDSASVRSFSSNGSTDGPRPPSSLENKMECVCSLISLLTLSPENNADLSGPLLDMSRSVESCVAMRQAGCIPLLVQLIHSKVSRETRDRAAKALRNIIHTQTDDKAGRREARVWRLLEQVREYCYSLEDLVEARKEGKEALDDDTTKHPSQSVAALMKLSFDEEHRHVVCQLGGLQALAALVSGDQAAHGSATDDNTCLTMRKYAGMTLTNLTFGDGNNKSLLCSFKDFMLALVEQLESPNDDMRQVTAAVLRNLSWRADTNSKQVLREVGAVKGLTKAAMTCQKEATLKSVLSALWNLTAHCSMNKVALCSVDGALGFLVDKLSYNSPTKTLAIVENAGGIMRNVSSHIAVREDYRQILRERNCLGVLLQHLKSPSLTVVSNSCGTLWNLSARCPQDQQFLWDHGAVPMLRSLIHSKHKMIAMGSSAALKNLLNSKPGKTQILTLDTTARNMNLPALPTLGARKQKALEQELDQNLAETCDNIEPATSPMTSNREEKNLFTATERQIAMNLERHRMTSSSPLMGNLASQISLSHSAQLSGYLSCSNTLLKGSLVTRSTTGGSASNVNRSESKDSVTGTHSDSVFEKVMRTGKVPIPTPRNKDLMKMDTASEAFNVTSKIKGGPFLRYPSQPPIPPPRSTTEMRTNYTESGYDVDQDSCDQPIDFSRKYSETKANDVEPVECKPKSEEQSKKYTKKENTFGDYQETDLDQPTDYSLRYAEHPSEHGSDMSPPPGPSVHEDTIKHFATEGTPYETPVIFSTATSMSDLRVIGKDGKAKTAPNVKENPEVLMSNSDEKDTCSLDDPPRHDNDRAILSTPSAPEPPKQSVFDTKFSSGMISPEKPVNYCDEGTPGYFSRVSSLSSLGDPTEEDNVAKKNAMATINVEPSQQEQNTTSVKDKEGSKAVTFATEAVSMGASGGASPRFVEDTPLMFSRTSSLGSLPECDQQDDQGSVLSEMSRLTSGCISPSEIPDSPGGSVSPSSRPPPTVLRAITPPTDANRVSSVFEERTSRFMVEHTPAQFSTATSLSSLTIDDEPKQSVQLAAEVEANTMSQGGNNAEATSAVGGDPVGILGSNTDPTSDEVTKGLCTGGDSCRVYVTEDTPGMSKAGSHSELSALSIDSEPKGGPNAGPTHPPPHDTSDSSNLSDAGDLLEECIQKGIANVVKNNGPPSDVSSINLHRDGVYRSLPPYLRSSTETVRMSHEYGRSARDSHSPSSERGACGRLGVERSEGVKGVQGVDGSPPPPLPPRPAALPAPPPRPPPPPPHETPPFEGRRHESRLPVKASRHRAKPAKAAAALLRNDSLSSLSSDSFGSTDREIFEETVQAGLSNPRNRYAHDKGKAHSAERPSDVQRHARHHKSLDRSDRTAQHRPKPGLTRSPYSYHGETSGRSDSLSSLSNESFGSTDKEVFERCVRAGMRAPTASSALERMRGDHYSRDRAILEEVIARGANSSQPNPNSKNVRTPPADADAGGDGTAPNITGSNECLAPRSHNTTLDDEPGEDLDESNESYADLPDGEWSDGDPAPTLKRADTWNDNTCPDDVTFPTISGSVHLETSIRSEVADVGVALPDLLEKSELTNMSRSRPDLTNGVLLEVSEPSFASLLESGEQRFDSIVSSAIELEAARLAAQLKSSLLEHGGMETSVTSLQSLDLDNVKPPSDLGSLLSLSASGQWDESQASRKSQRRKKSLPVASMVKRALGNSMHRGSSENLDSNLSFLDNVKPPSEMDHIDMESSMVSVSSIVSEAEGLKSERIPVVFDLSQPIQEFPLHGNLPHLYHDLDKVNPPSLFDEMAESTVEIEQTTAHHVMDDCASNTLNVVTDLPSGSENCTPLPSDVSSVESTPKKQRDPGYLTPKERRHASKDRYQTYTITDYSAESDVVLEVNSEEYVTWTKSVDELSTDSSAVTSGQTSRRKVSAKQRRLEDRARYQTQTVNVHSMLTQETNSSDPNIQSLKRRLAAKKTIKQKRIEDAERFRTRTLSEDIPPSPTFVTKDANFENVETTTGYDSLSSNEIGHQIIDEQHSDDVLSRDADSGHNEDDFELNSTQMQTYTRSFRTYLPVVESPASVDMCVVNNLKNIELTASYNRTMRVDKNQTPSSGDFASYEGDTNSDKGHSDSEENSPRSRAKPKIIKPEAKREASLDSNDSREEQDVPKAVRGRKKPAYVSPYRRNVNVTNTKKPVTPIAKTTPKVIKAPTKSSTSAKTAASTKTPSATTSPKKTVPNRSPTKVAQQKPIAPGGSKPLSLVRQGTFTKEESSVPAKDLPVPDKRTAVRATKATTPTKPANTSPSRLPQLNRYRPPLRKTNSNEKPKVNAKKNESAMRTSASNHSLQSNESGKTVTLGSRKGSASSVNSAQSSKANAKDVESKIASLWKKVEQSKKLTSKQDKRVWIEADKAETPRLIRSSTFEGQPKQTVSAAPKQKTTIGIRVSQIPSLRPKTAPNKGNVQVSATKKPIGRVFTRKQAST